MKMKNLLLACMLSATVAFTACDDNASERNDSTVDTVNDRDEDTHEESMEAREDAMEKVFTQYTELRDELYDGDAEGAKQQATEMKQALSTDQSKDMTPEQVTEWNTWANGLLDPLNKIEGAAAIDAQRMAFSNLSPLVRDGVKKYGVDEEVYYYHCPMAMDNKGAYWLSTSKDVSNPYFGDKMKTCGTSKETIMAQRD